MEDLAVYAFIAFALIAVVIVNSRGNLAKAKSIMLKCPRCGHEGTKDTFRSAASHVIGCFLLLLFVVPAIFYYGFFGSKVICPKCNNQF